MLINAEKLSEMTPLGWNIRKSTLVRNHVSLMNVGKLLGRAQLLIVVKECIQESNTIITANM